MKLLRKSPFSFFLSLSLFILFNGYEGVMGNPKSPQDERSYLTSFDLDGDSTLDRVSFSFTGGAHCCYMPHIWLSSDSSERKYPFRMDGGYVGGIDGSKPKQFRIEDLDADAMPEVFMRIEVYGAPQRNVPKKWTEA